MTRKPAKRETPLIKRVARNQLSKTTLGMSPTRNTTNATKNVRQRPVRIQKCYMHSMERLNSMVDILTRLADVPELANRVPRLRFQDRDKLFVHLEQPRYRLWNLKDGVHANFCSPLLHPRVIHQIRQALIRDVSTLSDLRVAWRFDLDKLRIMHRRKPIAEFLPFLDTFDLDIPNTHQDWESVKQDAIHNITKYFVVMKVTDSPATL